MVKAVALISMIIVLGLVNWSIVGKEKHLAEGQVAYLDLAPIDPRSLMQGDYMALRFRLANAVSNALRQQNSTQSRADELNATDGYAVARLDQQRIATFQRLYRGEVLSENEVRLRYRVRNGDVKLATNAFFFQEGHAKYYEPARFGQFRVDEEGELLLVGMFDKDLKALGADESGENQP